VIRVGINGLGRIGRLVVRHWLAWQRDESQPAHWVERVVDAAGLEPGRPVEIVALNELTPPAEVAYLLRRDSVHRNLRHAAQWDGRELVLGDARVPISAQRDPSEVAWGDHGVDVVLECTGAFRSRSEAARHLQAGARSVVISAPSDDADVTIVPGVNQASWQPDHAVVSMASCTTNCLAPLAKVLNDTCGIEYLWATTAHAYTSSQSLVDSPARKMARGRAAALNIVPTSTGAASAVEAVLPELRGRLRAMALRVPVADGSITDVVAVVRRPAAAARINEALQSVAQRDMKGILGLTDEELVSSDIIGDTRSCLVASAWTSTLGNMIKLLSWYDNEYAYAGRLLELAAFIGARLKLGS
jgi:glyceraldehyde-3-phosphate dehydrogenase type I